MFVGLGIIYYWVNLGSAIWAARFAVTGLALWGCGWIKYGVQRDELIYVLKQELVGTEHAEKIRALVTKGYSS